MVCLNMFCLNESSSNEKFLNEFCSNESAKKVLKILTSDLRYLEYLATTELSCSFVSVLNTFLA
jgi:hypothetical protein